MVDWVARIWVFIFRREKSDIAIEGLDKLAGNQREFNQQILGQLNEQSKRLDECDRDRNELRDISENNSRRIDQCEQRHKDRDVLDDALRSEMKALKQIQDVTGAIEAYSHEATHRILNALAPLSASLEVLLMHHGITSRDDEE